MPKSHNVSLDNRKNPELKRQMGELRGDMVTAAEARTLPDRFTVEPHPHLPQMIVHDTETGRSSTVPLFAYSNVRTTLNDLFGAPKLTAEERLQELGLPLEVECGSIVAYGILSQYEEGGLAYRLEIDGVVAGDYGVGRVELRDDGRFHVLTLEWDYVGNFGSLDDALEAADERISPEYVGPSYG